MKILIIGNGYIGQRCAQIWGDEAEITKKKILSVQDALEVIDQHKPNVVLNAAGVRGKPNVDWCETHQNETFAGNTKLPLNIAQACHDKGLYLLHIGSGCIFYGSSPDSKGWRENDFANPVAYYSKCKYAVDLVLGSLPNVGIARIRIPLDDRPNPSNIIDKLVSFAKVIDVENSITVIPDMIDVFYQLLQKKAEGIFHVTNPGVIRYRKIIELYKKYVNPKHTNIWIKEDDLLKEGLVVKVRSTNKLQSANLGKIGIIMSPIAEAAERAIISYSRAVHNNSVSA